MLSRTRAVPCCALQVQYSLLYRRPETNGVFEACKEQGVTLVAYSPLCQGLLTGKVTGQSMYDISDQFLSACKDKLSDDFFDVYSDAYYDPGTP